MTQRALVLDFGGVISRTLFETHDLSEQALGLAPGTLQWRGPFDPASDPLWRAMQAGEITERGYWLERAGQVGRLVGEDWDRMAQFVTRARGADPEKIIRPEAVAAIQQAKAAGCKLAILSNELDLFYGAGFQDRLPLLRQFDLIVDATYTEILKPDPRAYAFVTDGLGLTAEECVFIDDQPKNIQGGERAGMTTVLLDVADPQAGYERALTHLGLTTNEVHHA